MQKIPNKFEGLLKTLLESEVSREANSFTPLEVTIKGNGDSINSVQKMKNIIIVGVMEDDKNVMQSMQGSFSIKDEAVLSQAMGNMIKQLDSDKKLSDLIMASRQLFGDNTKGDK